MTPQTPGQTPDAPDSQPITEATVRLKVPFYDLDPMQVVWHGNYLKYFSRARLELFSRAGLEHLYRPDPAALHLYPVVRSEVKHVRPLRLGEEFLCTARLKEAKYKIVLAFEIRRLADGRVCARGRSEQVAVSARDMTLHYEIPVEVRRAFGLE